MAPGNSCWASPTPPRPRLNSATPAFPNTMTAAKAGGVRHGERPVAQGEHDLARGLAEQAGQGHENGDGDRVRRPALAPGHGCAEGDAHQNRDGDADEDCHHRPVVEQNAPAQAEAPTAPFNQMARPATAVDRRVATTHGLTAVNAPVWPWASMVPVIRFPARVPR